MELETVNPRYQEEALAGVEVGASGAGVVYIVYFWAIFFMFTGVNGLVCCF